MSKLRECLSRPVPGITYGSGRSRLSYCLFIVILMTILLPSLVILVHVFKKCRMGHNLEGLMHHTSIILSQNNVAHWLDYGTLLGAIRDNDIIPWDFDVDFAIPFEDCEKVKETKEAFTKAGYFMYLPGEWIPQKYNPILGHDGYLHKACGRVYDADKKYYVDLDWSRTFTYSQAIEQAQSRGMRLPANYKESDGDLMCNDEAFEVGGDPGGCRLKSWVYPLKKIDFLSQQMFVPNKPEFNLVAMYGPNWRTPKGKGYKKVICSFMPTTDIGAILFAIFTAIIPIALYFLYIKAYGPLDSTLPRYQPVPRE